LKRLVTNTGISEKRIKYLFVKSDGKKPYGTCMWQWVRLYY